VGGEEGRKGRRNKSPREGESRLAFENLENLAN